MRFSSLLALVLVLAASSCGGSPARPAPSPPTGGGSAPLSSVPTEDLARVARANDAFGLALWAELRRSRTGNLAISPASLSTALAMTWAGARGDTAAQMRDVLRLDGDEARTHAALGATIRSWNASADRGYSLRAANRLFAERSLRFEAPFLALTEQTYGAPTELLDFAGAPGASRARINGWVEDQTNRRIRDLLPDGSIHDDVRLVLVNAIYFKGSWKHRFDEAATREQAFFVTPGREVRARMMSQTGAFRFAAADGVRVVELPYVGDDLAMVLVLPEARDGLPAVEQRLDPAALDRWIAALRPSEEVVVALPRFRVEAREPLALSDPLRAMGMVLPFSDGDADFSGMTREEQLFIDAVFHKAFVEVNEEGTEAAAATAVVMARESAAQMDAFVADHPFLFFVRDHRTGSILFMGRVEDPST